MAVFRCLVHDLESCKSFYIDSLGFELIDQWGPAFATVKRDDLEVWLSGPETSAAKPMPDGRVPEPGGWNRVVLAVSDLESLVDKLRVSGQTFRNEILVGPGGKQILIEDPSGNPIELFEPR